MAGVLSRARARLTGAEAERGEGHTVPSDRHGNGGRCQGTSSHRGSRWGRWVVAGRSRLVVVRGSCLHSDSGEKRALENRRLFSSHPPGQRAQTPAAAPPSSNRSDIRHRWAGGGAGGRQEPTGAIRRDQKKGKFYSRIHLEGFKENRLFPARKIPHPKF